MLCAYQSGAVSDAQRLWIHSHLETCDFCDAEFRLLSEHPPAEEICPPAEMPPHIRSLAESILRPDMLSLEVWKEPSLSDV
jgi:hypothetical protein